MNLENSSILVVDDDHDIVNAIAKLLGKEGYRIYKAYNGLEAIDMLMQYDIQLILIAFMMPILNNLILVLYSLTL